MSDSHINGWDIKYGNSLLSVLSNGNFFVFVFFVISGFVLSRQYYQTNEINTIISSAQRRFLRLYIPVAFTLIIAYLMMKGHLFCNQEAGEICKSEWIRWMWTFLGGFKRLMTCLAYSTMFQMDNTFDTSLWTISIEFFGSLLVFSFLILTHNMSNRIYLILILLCYFYCTGNQYSATFVLGISLNYFKTDCLGTNKLRNKIVPGIMIAIALFLGSYPADGNASGSFFDGLSADWKNFATLWFHTIGAFVLILAFTIAPIYQSAITNKFFAFLGRISFSLYLLHPLIIGSFSCFVFLNIYKYATYNSSVIIVFITTVLFCFYLSWLMTKYVDDKGIEFSRWVYNRWMAGRHFKKRWPINNT